MSAAFCDALNQAVATVPQMDRVRFEVGLGPSAERWLNKKHANGQVHEPGTIGAFLACQRFNPGEIWDVGALYGYFTLLAASLFEGRVVAFEMHPAALPALYANVHHYARVVQGLVGDRFQGSRRVWISGFNTYEEPAGGWDKLADEPGAMKHRGENNRGRFFADVDFITLDEYAKQTGARPGLIKIDVEGYQAKAVLGGLATITQHRPVVIIELHDPEKVARFGTTNRDTVRPIFDLGYRGFWCGNFRDKNARFEAIDRIDAMDSQHERLSIMVMVPEDYH